MQLMVFSDSHGHLRKLEAALRAAVRPPDATLFLGDGLTDLARLDTNDTPTGTLFAVSGNCDWHTAGLDAPLSREVCLEGVKIWMLHGHAYRVKGSLDALIAAADARGADVVCFGHTHRAMERYLPAGTEYTGGALKKPLVLFNPGSLGEGSFGTLTVRNGQVLCGHGSV